MKCPVTQSWTVWSTRCCSSGTWNQNLTPRQILFAPNSLHNNSILEHLQIFSCFFFLYIYSSLSCTLKLIMMTWSHRNVVFCFIIADFHSQTVLQNLMVLKISQSNNFKFLIRLGFFFVMSSRKSSLSNESENPTRRQWRQPCMIMIKITEIISFHKHLNENFKVFTLLEAAERKSQRNKRFSNCLPCWSNNQ